MEKRENVSRIQIIRNRFSLSGSTEGQGGKRRAARRRECERESEERHFSEGQHFLEKKSFNFALSPFSLSLFESDFDHLSYLVPSLCSRKRRIFCVSNKKEGERNLHNKAASVSFFFLLSSYCVASHLDPFLLFSFFLLAILGS